MKRLATSILLSFGLSPVFASAQNCAISNQNFFQQHPVTLTGQPVATANVAPAAVETTAVHSEWSKEDDLVDGLISKAKLAKMKGVTNGLVDFLKDSCFASGAY